MPGLDRFLLQLAVGLLLRLDFLRCFVDLRVLAIQRVGRLVEVLVVGLDVALLLLDRSRGGAGAAQLLQLCLGLVRRGPGSLQLLLQAGFDLVLRVQLHFQLVDLLFDAGKLLFRVLGVQPHGKGDRSVVRHLCLASRLPAPSPEERLLLLGVAGLEIDDLLVLPIKSPIGFVELCSLLFL